MEVVRSKKWKVAGVGCGMFANGQYFPNISKEANAECVAAVDIVIERAELACKKYNIPKGTIKTWSMKVYHPEKYSRHGQKRGRPKEKTLTKDDWKERYEILKKYQAFLKAQRERK